MKYKLQIEKLKQLKMDGNLAMANQFEDNGYQSHTAILKPYILDNEFGNTYVRPQDALQAMLEFGKQFRKRADAEEKDNEILRSEIEELKKLIFSLEQQLEERNISIQAIEDYGQLEKENAELSSQVDDLKTDLHLTESKLRSSKIDVDLLKDALFIRNGMIQNLDKTIADLNIELDDRDNQIDRLEDMILNHQNLTQWIEEQIDPSISIYEVSHDFLENLYNKVHKINH